MSTNAKTDRIAILGNAKNAWRVFEEKEVLSTLRVPYTSRINKLRYLYQNLADVSEKRRDGESHNVCRNMRRIYSDS